jgi:hypothetical protein
MAPMTTTTTYSHAYVTLHCVGCQIGSSSLVPSVVGGLIGGATVFAGVLFAEYLTRRRERTQRFDDELWNLLSTGTEVFASVGEVSVSERDRRTTLVLAQMARLISASKPPQKNYEAKLRESIAIFMRFTKASAAWRNGSPPPTADEVLGNKIYDLSGEEIRRWSKGILPDE